MSTTRSYSDYTSRVSGLIGIPYSGMNEVEQVNLQGFFTTSINTMWNDNSWLEICPYGEARIAGSLLTYMNRPSNAVWVNTNMTGTDNAILNPVDSRITAGSLRETVTSGLHYAAQTYNQVPFTGYTFSCFVYPTGRQYVYLWVVESNGTSHYAVFNMTTGLQSAISTNTGDSASINQVSNGFYLLQLNYVSQAYGTAGPTANARIGTSSASVTNPASATFAGDTSKGFYSWGTSVFQTANTAPNSTIIPFAQTGEYEIDAVLNVYATNPNNTANPRALGYTLTPDGIQIVGSQVTSGYWNFPVTTATTNFGFQIFQPVYLYYRKEIPDFSGEDYDATATYAPDDQVLFEDSAGISDFYKNVVVTSAGQSPENTPAAWELITIPDFMFLYCVYKSFAQWLEMDGQLDKSAAMDNKAENYSMQESDRQERQMGWIPPMKVATWVTSQSRF